MTIEDLYQWAKENKCNDAPLFLSYIDDAGLYDFDLEDVRNLCVEGGAHNGVSIMTEGSVHGGFPLIEAILSCDFEQDSHQNS